LESKNWSANFFDTFFGISTKNHYSCTIFVCLLLRQVASYPCLWYLSGFAGKNLKIKIAFFRNPRKFLFFDISSRSPCVTCGFNEKCAKWKKFFEHTLWQNRVKFCKLNLQIWHAFEDMSRVCVVCELPYPYLPDRALSGSSKTTI